MSGELVVGPGRPPGDLIRRLAAVTPISMSESESDCSNGLGHRP